jgi:hypothetical protein
MLQKYLKFHLVLLFYLTFAVSGLLNQPVVKDNYDWTTFVSKTILSEDYFDHCHINFIFGKNTSFAEIKFLANLFSKDLFR